MPILDITLEIIDIYLMIVLAIAGVVSIRMHMYPKDRTGKVREQAAEQNYPRAWLPRLYLLLFIGLAASLGKLIAKAILALQGTPMW